MKTLLENSFMLLFLFSFSYNYASNRSLISFFQKGQHLEPFIMNFINSCESPKPKPSRPELTILSPTSENNKKVL